MNWLWIGLGVWIGINILYFVVRYFITSLKRESEGGISQGGISLLPFDTSKRKNDVRFTFFG
jgi:hypothetical protein